MQDRDSKTNDSNVERVVETVASWPNVALGEGRFNATSFRLGDKEIGHIHPRGAVDISYAPSLRDQLIADGRTEEHRVAPNSPTGTSFHVESADDVDDALRLLRLSYLFHVAVQRLAGDAIPEMDEFDIESELDELEPSDELRAVFETAVEGAT